jgi:hypothetical protein
MALPKGHKSGNNTTFRIVASSPNYISGALSEDTD